MTCTEHRVDGQPCKRNAVWRVPRYNKKVCGVHATPYRDKEILIPVKREVTCLTH